MLLTIFNLPMKTRYVDVKSLILSKCGFKEMILDNLTSDSNNSKKVTVGLAEEEDAAILVRKINGLFVDGQQLYVEAIKKKAASSVVDPASNQQHQPLLQQPYYQQSNYQPNYELGYTEMQQSRAQQSMVAPSMAYGGTYGSAQNASANYGYPLQTQYQSAQQQMMPQSVAGYVQGSPLGFSNHGTNPSVWTDQNDWNLAGNASAGNLVSQQGRHSSRWENTGDSSSRPRHVAPARDSGPVRPGQSRFGQETPVRDAGRNAPRRDFSRDAPSRDRARDAPHDQGRDRYQGRDRNQGRDQGRDRGRDALARDRGREPPARNAPFSQPPVRKAPFNQPAVRNAPPREHDRDAFYNRRPEPSRAPAKRPMQPPRTVYGDHVTSSAPQSRRFSQQQDGPKPYQLRSKPQPKPKNAESNYVPPNKRQKKNPQKAENPQAKVPSNFDLEKKKKQRTATWRQQIASLIAKEILKDPNRKTDIPPEDFLSELKRAVRCRLEALFGDNNKILMPEMLKVYREKYNGSCDTAFFNQVCKDIETNGLHQADAGHKAAPVDKNSGATSAVEKKPVVQTGDTTKIPSYPQGDKRASKETKKANAQIFQDEDILLSQLKPNMLKAMVDEIDELCTVVASEFEGESKPQLKKIDEHVKTTVVDDLKKMLKVNFAKRILNVGTIMLRIFNVPKIVSRSKLAPALAEYGVTSLRKSKMSKPPIYYGTCATYDDHDRLCSMEPIVVDGSTVYIKPFHLIDKNKKQRINSVKNSMAKDMNEEPITEELKELDDEADEDIINLNTDYDQNNTQEQNDSQGENENQDVNELQDTEMVYDEDTNGNIKLEPNEERENVDYNNAENAQLPDNVDDKSEINTEDTEESVSKSIEDNTEVENTENTDAAPNKSEENVNTAVEKLDFIADVDFNKENKNKEKDSFKIDEETDPEVEKDLSQLNAEDLVDFRGNNIDEIDMADLNDDDLEDW